MNIKLASVAVGLAYLLSACVTTGTTPAQSPSPAPKSEAPAAQAKPAETVALPAIVHGKMIGRTFTRNPAQDLSKTYAISASVVFSNRTIFTYDVVNKTNKTDHRVVVTVKKGSKWIVTGDIPVTAATTGLFFFGTVDTVADDDEMDGSPALTTCYVNNKQVMAMGFFTRGKLVQASGVPAWAVDKAGIATPVTGLVCKAQK